MNIYRCLRTGLLFKLIKKYLNALLNLAMFFLSLLRNKEQNIIFLDLI